MGQSVGAGAGSRISNVVIDLTESLREVWDESSPDIPIRRKNDSLLFTGEYVCGGGTNEAG
jgi:hypothetical protein